MPTSPIPNPQSSIAPSHLHRRGRGCVGAWPSFAAGLLFLEHLSLSLSRNVSSTRSVRYLVPSFPSSPPPTLHRPGIPQPLVALSCTLQSSLTLSHSLVRHTDPLDTKFRPSALIAPISVYILNITPPSRSLTYPHQPNSTQPHYSLVFMSPSHSS